MIQSISFSGNVIVGGSTYSALKASAGNIQGLPTEKLREQVSVNFDKLNHGQQHDFFEKYELETTRCTGRYPKGETATFLLYTNFKE